MYDRTCRGLSTDEIARREAAGQPRAVRFLVPDGATTFDDLVHGPIDVRPRQHRGLRHPPVGRLSDLPPLGRRRRRRDEDHARRARRRPHLEHAEAGAALPGDGRAAAGVRARAADSRAGQEAAEQAPRRDVGRRVRDAGLPARSDGEFSRAARLVARRRPGGVHARRAGRGGSRSRASAAATRSSIPTSSTGSISSTSMRLPAGEILRRLRPALEAAGLVARVARRTGSRLDRARHRSREAARAQADRYRRRMLRPFLLDAVERDAAAVAKHLSAPDLAPHLAAWRDRVA